MDNIHQKAILRFWEHFGFKTGTVIRYLILRIRMQSCRSLEREFLRGSVVLLYQFSNNASTWKLSETSTQVIHSFFRWLHNLAEWGTVSRTGSNKTLQNQYQDLGFLLARENLLKFPKNQSDRKNSIGAQKKMCKSALRFYMDFWYTVSRTGSYKTTLGQIEDLVFLLARENLLNFSKNQTDPKNFTGARIKVCKSALRTECPILNCFRVKSEYKMVWITQLAGAY